MLGAAALLLSLAPAPATVAGFYQSRQIEVGAALELRDDGRFRYMLDYGAVSESAEGSWSLDGKMVRLTTSPAPTPPRFELVSDDPAPPGELTLALEDAESWGGPLHAIVTIEGESEPALIVADETGRVDLRGRRITSVQPLMPITETAGEPVTLGGDRGHRLLFRFHANDFATADFRGEPLAWDGADLMLKRYDTEIRFVRVRP